MIKVMYLVDPEHTRIDHQELAVRALQQYQLKRALREVKVQRRAERNAARRLQGRRFMGLIPRHTSPTPQWPS